MRRFKFQVSVGGQEVAEGLIELDQAVIERAHSEEFRKYFLTFQNDSEVAAHIAYFMIVNKTDLSEIEGFMMPSVLARIVDYPQTCDYFEFGAVEVC